MLSTPGVFYASLPRFFGSSLSQVRSITGPGGLIRDGIALECARIFL